MSTEAIKFTWVLITIISSLISGIIGVIISIIYHRKYEKYRSKIDTLKNLVGYRFDLESDEFSKALNEIFVVFYDSKEVLIKLKNLYESITTIPKQESLINDKFLELFREMCRDINIDPNKYINESFFLKVFNNKNRNKQENYAQNQK